MYNFIHRKLVKDGSFSCIIQPNNDNFVLLVIEQSPYPGEENSHSRAADPPPATRASWPPPAQAQGEERDAPEPPSLPLLLFQYVALVEGQKEELALLVMQLEKGFYKPPQRASGIPGSP